MAYDVSKLKHARLVQGLSHVNLARRSGVNRITIAQLEEKAVEPRPETVKKLADTLGISMEDLIIEDEPNVA